MWTTLISLAWTGGVAWLLARAVRQFRGYQTLPAAAPGGADDLPELAVIVPARNEAPRIARCLRCLLAQRYPPGRLRIVVVDDNSTDGTPGVVRRVAAGLGRVRLVEGRPLPEGWAGKPHAYAQGVDAAPRTPWLCFLDADTAPAPDLLATAVAFALTRSTDMLSLEPFQELGSFWERVIIPAGMYLLAFTRDLRRINDPASGEAAANGQFLLIRREVYDAVGGFAAVAAELCEDTALARRVKGAGFRLALVGAESLLRVRMYRGLGPLWEGLAKNVVQMAGGLPRTLAAAALALLLAWAPLLVPWWTWARAVGPRGAPAWAPLAVTVLGSLALVGIHFSGARHFRIPLWYGLTFPLGYTAAAALAADGVLHRLRGSVSWKGRVYTPPRNRDAP